MPKPNSSPPLLPCDSSQETVVQFCRIFVGSEENSATALRRAHGTRSYAPPTSASTPTHHQGSPSAPASTPTLRLSNLRHVAHRQCGTVKVSKHACVPRDPRLSAYNCPLPRQYFYAHPAASALEDVVECCDRNRTQGGDADQLDRLVDVACDKLTALNDGLRAAVAAFASTA